MDLRPSKHSGYYESWKFLCHQTTHFIY